MLTPMATAEQADSGLLRGWKAIEGYLRLTRKTILLHGYPVRRLLSGRGTVWAFADELDRHARRPAPARARLELL